jgi:hypothetical protein
VQKPLLYRIGRASSIAAVAMCAAVHVATFVTVVPPAWGLALVAVMIGVLVLTNAVDTQRPFKKIPRRWLPHLIALTVYAMGWFLHYYRVTGGSTGESILNGQHVAMNGDRVLRVITEQEFRMFPTLWTRVMSAWIGAGAAAILTGFAGRDDSAGSTRSGGAPEY